VRVCDVEVSGKDGQTHSLTVKEESLFSAAAIAISEWSRLWWWPAGDPILTIRSGNDEWRVRSQRVVDWEFRRRNAERQREKA